ncbi:MAG: MBL fold metallo-hydrolase [Candidatus Asgardarchaeia archaeon]
MALTQKISDKVYLVSEFLKESSLSINIYLIKDDEPALIDSGAANTAKPMLEELKKLIPLKDIKWIFVTHEHPDHIGGLSEIMSEAYNAKVVAHKHIEVHLGFLGIFGRNVSVTGGEKFNLGSSTIEIHYAPIETLGTIVFLLKPENILFSGDYFGQITPEWKPFTNGMPDDDVIKRIIEFHEGLGYDQNVIKKYLGKFEKIGIRTIAVGHGSVINENTRKIISKAISAKLKKSERGRFWARIFGRG